MTDLKKGLIVSCQAVKGESLYNLGLMKYFAKAAVLGGAVGIRCCAIDVKEIKDYVGDVPVIGLVKECYKDSEVYITPTKKEIDTVIESGADVIALDATLRKRPFGETLNEQFEYIRKRNKDIKIMADIATLDEALNAEKLGADYIGCTLRGYTESTKGVNIPDMLFIESLVNSIKESKVIVEGGIWEIGQVKEINKYQPYAVVIGTSITRPKDITERFNNALKLSE